MNRNNQSSNHNIIKNFNNVMSILCLINPTSLFLLAAFAFNIITSSILYMYMYPIRKGVLRDEVKFLW